MDAEKVLNVSEKQPIFDAAVGWGGNAMQRLAIMGKIVARSVSERHLNQKCR